MSVITIRNLVKNYGKIRAVDNLNIDIDEGNCVGLLGPNGAGKTTTIKILCGVLRPTKGEAFINGINVTKHPERALKHVGAIVERPEIYSCLTAREFLAYMGRLRGMNPGVLERRIKEVLELVGLSEQMNMRVGKFSTGMKQRLIIAQAILHEPEILLLDEPLQGLDPKGIVEMRELIKRLHRDGCTILFASHILSEVQEICNKVAVIDKGKLLLYDDIDRLAELSGARSVEIKALHPLDDHILDEIKRKNYVISVRRQNSDSAIVSLRGNDHQLADLLEFLVEELRIKLTSFAPSEKILEEVYLKLVKEVS